MSQAGYTMVEMVVVMGIVMISVALAVPLFRDTIRDQRLNSIARNLIGDVRRAQSLAATGRQVSAGPPVTRIQAAGIRFDTATRYVIYVDVDTDATNSNETDVALVDLDAASSQNKVRITAPAVGTKIRFRRDGTTTSRTVTFGDSERNKSRTITISAGGQARID